MGANIITGYTGARHITPAMDAQVYRAAFGSEDYILCEGNKVSGSMPSINEFEIMDGIVSMQGHQIKISQETLAVDTCANGYKRIDLVCVRFAHDNDSLVDSASLVVIKGTAVQNPNEPSEPSHNTGDIDAGASMVDFPLYRIDLDGSTVTFELIAEKLPATLSEVAQATFASSKNSIVRPGGGKNLGTVPTADQLAAIADGSFEGLMLDDYWKDTNDRVWRIWGFDWFLHKGDTECTTHHVVIIPDENLLKSNGSTTKYMKDSNDTSGGYKATKYRSTYRATAKNAIAAVFGASHILAHRELISNAVSSGKASGWEWLDADVELPNEVMIFGATIWANYTDGGSGYQVGANQPILPLAMLKPERICNRENWWLRDVASATWFAIVGSNGFAYAAGASYAGVGVRPYFLLS